MKIETYRDKVVLSVDEVQRIVKEHIRKETGRIVDDDVYFQTEPGSEKQVTAYAWLKPKDESKE